MNTQCCWSCSRLLTHLGEGGGDGGGGALESVRGGGGSQGGDAGDVQAVAGGVPAL